MTPSYSSKSVQTHCTMEFSGSDKGGSAVIQLKRSSTKWNVYIYITVSLQPFCSEPVGRIVQIKPKMQCFVYPCPFTHVLCPLSGKNSGHYRYPDESGYPDVVDGALTQLSQLPGHYPNRKFLRKCSRWAKLTRAVVMIFTKRKAHSE